MTTANTLEQGKTPYMLWGQTDTTISISIKVDTPSCVSLNYGEDSLDFSGRDALNNVYSISLELFDKIKVEESKYEVGLQKIECIIQKNEPELWNSLTKTNKFKNFIKIDWDKWTEFNDDEEPVNNNNQEMDFSKLMGQMGGMGGMPGMEGMGGMPGMEGMGGMPDITSMEDVNDKDDNGGETLEEKLEKNDGVETTNEERLTELSTENVDDVENKLNIEEVTE